MRVFWGVLAAVAVWGQVVDRIAVVVGNTVITETEVTQEARLEAFLNQTPLKLDAETKRTAADRLVDQQLIRNEMQIGAYPAPTDDEVSAMYRNLAQERGGEEALRGSLTKYGITEQQLRGHLRWQLAALRFTDMRFSPAVPGIPDQPPAGAAAAPASSGPDRATTGGTGRPSTDGQWANRTAPAAAAPAPAGDVDQQLDAWLKLARTGTKIQFKKGAFQ